MYGHTTLTLTTAAVLCLAVALPVGDALAQQKQRASFKNPAENQKITQQQNIDVGDAPNHIVRVYETHGTFPNNAPVIDGLKLVEVWSRGIADLTDGNGSSMGYTVFVMENGDRLFSRLTNVLQNTAGKVAVTSSGSITGGTGRFTGAQGIARQATNLDFRTGFVETLYEIEYAIGK